MSHTIISFKKMIGSISLYLLIYLAYKSIESTPLTAVQLQCLTLIEEQVGIILLAVSPFFSILCIVHFLMSAYSQEHLHRATRSLATRSLCWTQWTPALSHLGKRRSFLSNIGGAVAIYTPVRTSMWSK